MNKKNQNIHGLLKFRCQCLPNIQNSKWAKQAVVLSWLKEVHVCLFILTVNLSDQLQVIKMDQNANWKEKVKEQLWTGNAAAHRPGAIDGWSFQCVWVSTGDAAIHRPGGTEGWSLLWVLVSTVLAELFIWVWLNTEKMVQWLFGNCGLTVGESRCWHIIQKSERWT